MSQSRTTRRSYLKYVGAGAVVAALAAAGYGIYEYTKPAKPKTLELWISPYVAEEDKVIRPLLDRFESETGVHVTTLTVPWPQMTDKTIAAAAGGGGPHAVFTSAPRVATLAGRKILASVNDVVEQMRPRVRSAMAIDVMRHPDGNFYAVPWDGCFCWWVLNVGMLKHAGVADDVIDRMSTGTWTIDEFVALQEKVRTDDQYFYVFPAATQQGGALYNWEWIFGCPYGFLDRPFGTPIFNSEQHVNALRFLNQIKEYMPDGVETIESSEGLWYSQKAAFYGDSDIYYFTYFTEKMPKEHPEIDWRVATPPVGPTGHQEIYDWNDYWGILNNKPTEEIEWTKKLMLFLFLNGSEYLVDYHGTIPANKDGLNYLQQKLGGTVAGDAVALYTALTEGGKYSHEEPIHERAWDMVKIRNEETQAMFAGVKTPEKAANDMQTRAMQLLQG